MEWNFVRAKICVRFWKDMWNTIKLDRVSKFSEGFPRNFALYPQIGTLEEPFFDLIHLHI